MPFTPFSSNVRNIESLGTDKPNADLGLTGLQLRQRFDKAVSDIKTWINDTFLAEIAGISGASNIGIAQITGLNANTVQTALSEINGKTGNVNDGAVTLNKLSSGFALPGSKMADGAVTKNKIASGATYTAVTATLTSSGWDEKSQSVSVSGITADKTVVVSAAPASFTAYCEAQIRASELGSGTITFVCEDVPAGNVTVNIAILT